MNTPRKENVKDWEDDETMTVLFSPFRENRDVNPHSWDRKLKFWTDETFNFCINNSTVVFNTKTLPLCFKRKDKIPTCLGLVIQEGLKNGKFQPVEEYRSNKGSSWLSWGYESMVKKPVSWTFKTLVQKPLGSVLGGGGEPQKDTEGQDLVVPELLKLKAEEVFNRHLSSVKNNTTDSLRSYKQMCSMCNDLCSDSHTFELAITELCRQKKCQIIESEDHDKVLKFATKNTGAITPPSDCDIRLYKVKMTEATLQNQIRQLQSDMDKCREQAKQFLQQGLKNSAKNMLRRKKKLEMLRENKETALENIHHMMTQIEQAESNKMVLDAYASGAEAYKKMSQKYGLNADKIDDVMLNVQETYEMEQEINDTMATNPLDTTDVTQEDLESELELILQGEEYPDVPLPHDPHQDLIDTLCKMDVSREEDEEGSFELPPVPSFDPASPTSVQSKRAAPLHI